MIGIELIQVALGTRKTLSHVPTETEWEEAYAFAQKQAVVGICYAGVQKVLSNSQEGKTGASAWNMSLDLLMDWVGQAEHIKSQNELMNDKCRKLCRKLEEDGFWCCILKGQGNLVNYGLTPASIPAFPNRERASCGEPPFPRREGEIYLADLRTPGDIDVWVKPKEKVVEYVRNLSRSSCGDGKAKKELDVVYHHVDWEFEDTPVELHMRPSWMYNPITNRRLQRWCENESTNHGTLKSQELGVTIPAAEFNRVYQLVHIYRHLFNEGIGLRQLLDYYFVLKTLPTPLSRGEYMHTLSRFGMKKFTATVMWVLQEVLDPSLPSLKGREIDWQKQWPWMLCEPNEKYGRFLFDEVMKAGNFGKYDKRLTYDRTKTLERGWGRLKRMSRLMTFGPWEVLCAPGWKVWHYFWRKRQ